MGHKQVDIAAINIARMCCAYACYLHAKKHNEIFSEVILRTAFIEYAQSAGWQYEAEFRLDDDPRPKGGSYRKFDAVLAYNKQAVAIEYKFPSLKNLRYNDLTKDVKKITSDFGKHKRIKPFHKKYGFILIVAMAEAYAKFKPKGLKRITINDENWRQQLSKKQNLAKSYLVVNDI